LIDRKSYILYIPAGLDLKARVPLVVALHPAADARGMTGLWKKSADAYGWMVFASKEFRNGQDMPRQLSEIAALLNTDILVNYPVDRRAIIAAGFSGGGMGAHAFSFWYPGLISAVVVNTGKMNDMFQELTDRYPEGKKAVFIASPTDFRYREMKHDCEILKKRRWETEWIEFAGGHMSAPPECYDEAALWLNARLCTGTHMEGQGNPVLRKYGCSREDGRGL
jgi:predicted esterase